MTEEKQNSTNPIYKSFQYVKEKIADPYVIKPAAYLKGKIDQFFIDHPTLAKVKTFVQSHSFDRIVSVTAGIVTLSLAAAGIGAATGGVALGAIALGVTVAAVSYGIYSDIDKNRTLRLLDDEKGFQEKYQSRSKTLETTLPKGNVLSSKVHEHLVKYKDDLNNTYKSEYKLNDKKDKNAGTFIGKAIKNYLPESIADIVSGLVTFNPLPIIKGFGMGIAHFIGKAMDESKYATEKKIKVTNVQALREETGIHSRKAASLMLAETQITVNAIESLKSNKDLTPLLAKNPQELSEKEQKLINDKFKQAMTDARNEHSKQKDSRDFFERHGIFRDIKKFLKREVGLETPEKVEKSPKIVSPNVTPDSSPLVRNGSERKR